MPTLTVDNFKIGIDTRRGKDVSDANRLRACINATINNGGAIEKRGGLRNIGRANSDCEGLLSTGDNLVTFGFTNSGDVSIENELLITKKLRPDVATVGAFALGTSYSVNDSLTTDISTDVKARVLSDNGSSVLSAYTVWSSGDSTITEGDIRVATGGANPNIYFVAENSGTTGSSEPTWVVTAPSPSAPQAEDTGASTTNDNGITWKAFYLLNPNVGDTTQIGPYLIRIDYRSPSTLFNSTTTPSRQWFADTVNGLPVCIMQDADNTKRLFYIDDDGETEDLSQSVSSPTDHPLTGVLGGWEMSFDPPILMQDTLYGDIELLGIFGTTSGGSIYFRGDTAIPAGAPAFFQTVSQYQSFTPVNTFTKSDWQRPEGARHFTATEFLFLVDEIADFNVGDRYTVFDADFNLDGVLEDKSPGAPGDITPSPTRNVTVTYDGTTFYPNEVTDLNVPLNGDSRTPAVQIPDNPSAIKIADRIYMASQSIIGYSALESPKDWTDNNQNTGAGFLTAGRQAGGSGLVRTVGEYQGKLIASFDDRSQSWLVNQDANLNSFDQSIDAVGSRFPRSFASVSGDTFFLSPNGIRSISLLSLTNNLADVDVGTAIDSIVRTVADNTSDAWDPDAMYNAKEGQYQLFIGSSAYVYTFSRTAKISAWSEFSFTTNVDYAVRHNGEAYLMDTRRGIYRIDSTKYVDDRVQPAGTIAEDPIAVDVQMAFLDMKKPGVEKQIYGFDFVGEGTCDVSFIYQYIDDDGSLQEAETERYEVTNTTRPDELLPVDLVVVSIAPRFQSNANTQALRIDAINFYYFILSEFS